MLDNEPIDHYDPTPLTPLSCLHHMSHHLSIETYQILTSLAFKAMTLQASHHLETNAKESRNIFCILKNCYFLFKYSIRTNETLRGLIRLTSFFQQH